MRRYRAGSFVRVAVSEREVGSFALRWPCFGDVRPMTFLFDLSGNLVDVTGDKGSDLSGVAALADDAKAYALGGQRCECRGECHDTRFGIQCNETGATLAPYRGTPGQSNAGYRLLCAACAEYHERSDK